MPSSYTRILSISSIIKYFHSSLPGIMQFLCLKRPSAVYLKKTLSTRKTRNEFVKESIKNSSSNIKIIIIKAIATTCWVHFKFEAWSYVYIISFNLCNHSVRYYCSHFIDIVTETYAKCILKVSLENGEEFELNSFLQWVFCY